MHRMRSLVLAPLLALAAITPNAWADAGPAQAGTPAMVALFVDRPAIVRDSKAGKSIQAQVEALAQRMESDYRPENEQLQRDIQALQTQAATISPEQRQQRVKDLEARRQAFQQKVQARQTAIQNGMADARGAMERALGPILEKLMLERGANALLDRSTIVLGATELDVTSTVLERLDAALPTVTVTPRP